MNDWLRSVTVLAMAVVGVIVVTLGLAALIVPSPATSAQDQGAETPGASSDDGGSGVRPSVVPNPFGLGGALTVTGDRDGTFHLTREALEDRYTLVGDGARMIFDGNPIGVAQLSYDGLEFFPDPDECTITPGALDTTTGVGRAQMVCEEIADVRGNGVVTISGEIGLPVSFLAAPDFPPAGGSLVVGDETWTFEGAFLLAWRLPVGGTSTDFNMSLVDEATGGALHFTYDIETHGTDLAAVEHDAVLVPTPAGSCALTMDELGRYSPRAAVIEMTISCAAVEVPGIGTVPIRGSVVVEQLEYPA